MVPSYFVPGAITMAYELKWVSSGHSGEVELAPSECGCTPAKGISLSLLLIGCQQRGVAQDVPEPEERLNKIYTDWDGGFSVLRHNWPN